MVAAIFHFKAAAAAEAASKAMAQQEAKEPQGAGIGDDNNNRKSDSNNISNTKNRPLSFSGDIVYDDDDASTVSSMASNSSTGYRQRQPPVLNGPAITLLASPRTKRRFETTNRSLATKAPALASAALFMSAVEGNDPDETEHDDNASLSDDDADGHVVMKESNNTNDNDESSESDDDSCSTCSEILDLSHVKAVMPAAEFQQQLDEEAVAAMLAAAAATPKQAVMPASEFQQQLDEEAVTAMLAAAAATPKQPMAATSNKPPTVARMVTATDHHSERSSNNDNDKTIVSDNLPVETEDHPAHDNHNNNLDDDDEMVDTDEAIPVVALATEHADHRGSPQQNDDNKDNRNDSLAILPVNEETLAVPVPSPTTSYYTHHHYSPNSNDNERNNNKGKKTLTRREREVAGLLRKKRKTIDLTLLPRQLRHKKQRATTMVAVKQESVVAQKKEQEEDAVVMEAGHGVAEEQTFKRETSTTKHTERSNECAAKRESVSKVLEVEVLDEPTGELTTQVYGPLETACQNSNNKRRLISFTGVHGVEEFASFSKKIPKAIDGHTFVDSSDKERMEQLLKEICPVRFEETGDDSWIIHFFATGNDKLHKRANKIIRWTLQECYFKYALKMLRRCGRPITVECDPSQPLKAKVECCNKIVLLRPSGESGGADACSVERLRPALSRGAVLLAAVNGEPCESRTNFLTIKKESAESRQMMTLSCVEFSPELKPLKSARETASQKNVNSADSKSEIPQAPPSAAKSCPESDKRDDSGSLDPMDIEDRDVKSSNDGNESGSDMEIAACDPLANTTSPPSVVTPSTSPTLSVRNETAESPRRNTSNAPQVQATAETTANSPPEDTQPSHRDTSAQYLFQDKSPEKVAVDDKDESVVLAENMETSIVEANKLTENHQARQALTGEAQNNGDFCKQSNAPSEAPTEPRDARSSSLQEAENDANQFYVTFDTSMHLGYYFDDESCTSSELGDEESSASDALSSSKCVVKSIWQRKAVPNDGRKAIKIGTTVLSAGQTKDSMVPVKSYKDIESVYNKCKPGSMAVLFRQAEEGQFSDDKWKRLRSLNQKQSWWTAIGKFRGPSQGWAGGAAIVTLSAVASQSSSPVKKKGMLESANQRPIVQLKPKSILRQPQETGENCVAPSAKKNARVRFAKDLEEERFFNQDSPSTKVFLSLEHKLQSIVQHGTFSELLQALDKEKILFADQSAYRKLKRCAVLTKKETQREKPSLEFKRKHRLLNIFLWAWDMFELANQLLQLRGLREKRREEAHKRAKLESGLEDCIQWIERLNQEVKEAGASPLVLGYDVPLAGSKLLLTAVIGACDLAVSELKQRNAILTTEIKRRAKQEAENPDCQFSTNRSKILKLMDEWHMPSPPAHAPASASDPSKADSQPDSNPVQAPYPQDSAIGANRLEHCRYYLMSGRCPRETCQLYHSPSVVVGRGLQGPLKPSEPKLPPCPQYLVSNYCTFGGKCVFSHDMSTCGERMLVVGNLPTSNLSYQQVQDYFRQVAPIQMVQVPDGRGCAYVLFETKQGAELVLSRGSTKFRGEWITIRKYAGPENTQSASRGNSNDAISTETGKGQDFSSSSNPQPARGRGGPVCVKYLTEGFCDGGEMCLGSHRMAGKERRVIVVENLPRGAKWQDLKDCSRHIASIVCAEVQGRFGAILFQTEEGAKRAISLGRIQFQGQWISMRKYTEAKPVEGISSNTSNKEAPAVAGTKATTDPGILRPCLEYLLTKSCAYSPRCYFSHDIAAFEGRMAFISNLPGNGNAAWQEVKDFFRRIAPVDGVEVRPGKNIGTILFKSEEGAKRAISLCSVQYKGRNVTIEKYKERKPDYSYYSNNCSATQTGMKGKDGGAKDYRYYSNNQTDAETEIKCIECKEQAAPLDDPRFSSFGDWLFDRSQFDMHCLEFAQGRCKKGNACDCAHVWAPDAPIEPPLEFKSELVQELCVTDQAGESWLTCGYLDGSLMIYPRKHGGVQSRSTGVYWYRSQGASLDALRATMRQAQERSTSRFRLL